MYPPNGRSATTTSRPHTPSRGGAPATDPPSLHAAQPTQVFRSRIGSLRKALKSRVEFVFVDAPFPAQGLPGGAAAAAAAADDGEEGEEGVQGGSGGRSWWQWTDTGPAGRPSKAANYTGDKRVKAALCGGVW